MSAERIVSLYDLADGAYDAKEIRDMSERLGLLVIAAALFPYPLP